MSNPETVLEMRGISKEFPGVKALTGVDFRLFPGEIHALMGENGAGKSTLIKVLTGVYQIDAGEVVLAGETVSIGSPLQAQEAGVSTVYQEVNLCPNLSVAENIFIGREPRRAGAIRWKEMRRAGEGAARAAPAGSGRVRPAELLLPRHPAVGGDRPGGRRVGEGADPRRAHLEPRPR